MHFRMLTMTIWSTSKTRTLLRSEDEVPGRTWINGHDGRRDLSPFATLFLSILLFACLPLGLWGCAKSPPPPPDASSSPEAGPSDTASPVSGTVAISAATPAPRPTTALGTSYWQWAPTYGNLVAGTEAQVLALAPVVMRVGGSNNDTNIPDVFDDTQMDLAATYAQAIGAQMILQVPVLATNNTDAGSAAGPAMAAAMVQYANVTKAYGVKYFSIGNEPDLYATGTGSAGIPDYTPEDYCATATDYVAAMKAVDGTIKIVGPDLSWKYQTGDNDWLTPILTTCGSLFDIVSIHRYPIDPTQTTVANAAADAPALRGVIGHVQTILQATGNGNKPLAITECNITWDGTPSKSILPASPGTVPAGLWAADAFGVGLETGLWATVFWSTREGWTLGLFVNQAGPPQPQPEYWALDLYAEHFGPTLLSVSSTPTGVRAYASRNQTDDATQVIVVNWNQAPAALAFTVDGLATAPTPPTFALPALSVGAIEIPDTGTASALVYGETQHQTALPPQPLPSQ